MALPKNVTLLEVEKAAVIIRELSAAWRRMIRLDETFSKTNIDLIPAKMCTYLRFICDKPVKDYDSLEMSH